MYQFLIYKEPIPEDFLNSDLVFEYISLYNVFPENTNDLDLALVDGEYTMGYSCPVCYLYGKLKKNNEFRTFFEEFTFCMQFKPLFVRVFSLYSCVLIKEVLRLFNYDNSLSKEYLINLLTPRAFILHFSIKNCSFHSLSSDISDSAPLHIGFIDKYNHLVAKESLSLCSDITISDEKTPEKKSDTFEKNTLKKQITHSLLFSSSCKGECQLSQEQYMRDMMKHFNISMCERELSASSAPSDNQDVMVNSVGRSYTEVNNALKVISSLFEHNNFTHLTWLRTFEALSVKRNENAEEDKAPGYINNMTNLSRYGQECILCNLMVFDQWYTYLENHVFVNLSRYNGVNALNLCSEYISKEKQKTGKYAIHDFIHSSLNYTDFMWHFLISPLCQINRSRAKFFHNFSLNDVKHTYMPCIQSIINALLVQLIISYRQGCSNTDFLALKGIIKKLSVNLSCHDIPVYESIFYSPVQ